MDIGVGDRPRRSRLGLRVCQRREEEEEEQQEGDPNRREEPEEQEQQRNLISASTHKAQSLKNPSAAKYRRASRRHKTRLRTKFEH